MTDHPDIGKSIYHRALNEEYTIRGVVDGLYIIKSVRQIHGGADDYLAISPQIIHPKGEFNYHPKGLGPWETFTLEDGRDGMIRRPVSWVENMDRDGYMVIPTTTGDWAGNFLLGTLPTREEAMQRTDTLLKGRGFHLDLPAV